MYYIINNTYYTNSIPLYLLTDDIHIIDNHIFNAIYFSTQDCYLADDIIKYKIIQVDSIELYLYVTVINNRLIISKNEGELLTELPINDKIFEYNYFLIFNFEIIQIKFSYDCIEILPLINLNIDETKEINYCDIMIKTKETNFSLSIYDKFRDLPRVPSKDRYHHIERYIQMRKLSHKYTHECLIIEHCENFIKPVKIEYM